MRCENARGAETNREFDLEQIKPIFARERPLGRVKCSVGRFNLKITGDTIDRMLPESERERARSVTSRSVDFANDRGRSRIFHDEFRSFPAIDGVWFRSLRARSRDFAW